MRNLAASFMALVVYSLVVSLSSNSCAFAYAMEHFPFRLTDSDDFDSSIKNILERYENSNFNIKNNIDGQEESITDSNDESVHDIQNSYKKTTYLRAALETSAILGSVTLVYWARDNSSYDYDYDTKFDTLLKKLSGKAIRFDDNNIEANSFPGHPLSGSYYYLIARNNNLSRTGSFLWSFAASTINEFLIEYREVASISDLLVTPVAGAIIGEAMYKFGIYFRCTENKDDLLYRILAAVIDPVALGHSFIWSDVPYKYSQGDICHYTPIQKDISIFTGASVSYHKNTNNYNIGPIFGFHGKLYLIPQYGQEANIDRFFKEPILSEIGIEASITEKKADNVHFLAKTVLAAYYRQNIVRDFAGETTGYSFFIGPASAFEHIQYNTGEFEDWIGALHVFGPSMEFTSFYRAGYVRVGLDVFADFAMVRSYALTNIKRIIV